MAGNMGMWDLPSLNYRNPPVGASMNNSFGHSSVYSNNSLINTPLGRVFTSPPPLPARPVRSSYNSYNPYSSPFNSYGGYGYYGDYRPGYNSYRFGSGYYNGYSNNYPESRFIQFAEESSRPAFQTIQSILQAFSSVTVMFESSFHAIYSSYMSVLGVADNFGKLRSAFSQIFSTFAVIKTLNWIFKKLCCMLGVNREKFTKDMAWSEALSDKADINSSKTSNKRQTWPLLLFMSILIGGPYLLFKLMSEIYPQPVQDVWIPAEQPGSLAIGLYDFHAASNEELSFSAQQKLMIAPKKYQNNDCPGWVLACDENRKTGLIPNNYIGVIMQSEKTGETYIQHNGQTYQHPVKNLNSFKNTSKSHNNEDKSPEKNSEESSEKTEVKKEENKESKKENE